MHRSLTSAVAAGDQLGLNHRRLHHRNSTEVARHSTALAVRDASRIQGIAVVAGHGVRVGKRKREGGSRKEEKGRRKEEKGRRK